MEKEKDKDKENMQDALLNIGRKMVQEKGVSGTGNASAEKLVSKEGAPGTGNSTAGRMVQENRLFWKFYVENLSQQQVKYQFQKN